MPKEAAFRFSLNMGKQTNYNLWTTDTHITSALLLQYLLAYYADSVRIKSTPTPSKYV